MMIILDCVPAGEIAAIVVKGADVFAIGSVEATLGGPGTGSVRAAPGSVSKQTRVVKQVVTAAPRDPPPMRTTCWLLPAPSGRKIVYEVELDKPAVQPAAGLDGGRGLK